MKSRYEFLDCFIEGMARVERDGKCGYIDTSGNEVIPCRYRYTTRFHGGMAMVLLDGGVTGGGMWAMFDKKGNMLFSRHCEILCEVSDGAIRCKEVDGTTNFLDTEGRPLFDATFDNAGDFHDGFAVVCKAGKWGLIDRQGRMVLPFKFTGMGRCFHHNGVGYLTVTRGRKESVIDLKGNVLRDFRTGERPLAAPNGLIALYRRTDRYNHKAGIISLSGEEVVPCIYDHLACWEGMICINIGYKRGFGKQNSNGRWGWTDWQGRTIVEPQYSQEWISFSEGFARIQMNGKWGLVNIEGEVVISQRFDSVMPFSNGFAVIEWNGKQGIINREGRTVVPIVYDRLCGDFSEGTPILVDDGDEQFYINLSGERILF
jgi:hypothetical protein